MKLRGGGVCTVQLVNLGTTVSKWKQEKKPDRTFIPFSIPAWKNHEHTAPKLLYMEKENNVCIIKF